jgi:hypothetical protein
MTKTFTCAMCHRTLECGWSEEEALAELKEVWGDVPPEACDQVCDDCWELIRPDGTAMINAACNPQLLDLAAGPHHEWCRSGGAVVDSRSRLRWCFKCGCPGDHEDAKYSCPGRHLYRYEAAFSNTQEGAIAYLKIPYRQEDIW